jgi:hypothetical protein
MLGIFISRVLIGWGPKSYDVTFRRNGIGVRVEQVRPRSVSDENDRWGFEGATVPVIVRRLTVIVDGRTCITFRSAYADLSNVNRVHAYRKNGDIIVTMEGGDADASYDAVFVYRGGYLRSRKVADGEFPREHNERTVYTSLPPEE